MTRKRLFSSKICKNLVALCCGIVCLSAGQAYSESGFASGEQLLERMARGGFVMLWRHGHASMMSTHAISGGNRSATGDFDCRGQRNMSFRGYADSLMIGKVMRAKGIRPGKVYASPYCRTRQTAFLAVGAHITNLEDSLKSVCEVSWETLKKRQVGMRRLLSEAPPKGRNTILVTHSCNIDIVFPKAHEFCGFAIAQGDAVIFKPLGQGNIEFVGCISVEQWKTADATL